MLGQIHALELIVPHAATNTDTSNENSEYTHHAGHEKNCYMVFHTSYAENCYYGYGIKKAKSCIDNHYCHESELCYECVDVHGCYDLGWCQDCGNCSASRFIADCVGCSQCLFCVGLRNKKYCVLNEQLSPEEYAKRLKSLQMGSYAAVQELAVRYHQLQLEHTLRALQIEMTEDSLGDHLYRARDAQYCFDSSDIEHSKYCSQLQLGTRYCHDIYQFGIDIELCYDCAQIGYNIYHCQFCYELLQNCSDLCYCISCSGAKHCFGCVGLKQATYCILNRQYTKEEYEALLPKILKKMIADGEYGEFFPLALCPSGYNETMAQAWHPKTKKEVMEHGWSWEDHLPFTTGKETLHSLPDVIDDVPDSIVNEVLACTHCQRNYKIIPQELEFYRQQHYPLPRECFSCRRERRMQQRNPRRFWKRPCGKCSREIQSTYSPDRPEKVYCEDCYLKAIY